MPRLKVCGINAPAFAAEAARLGVDYLGLIFAERSPRRVTVEAAREIVAAAGGPRFAGVFTTQPADEIERTASSLGIGTIQLHGDYDASAVASLRKAGFEVWALDGSSASASADAVLVDGRDGEKLGGTGRVADWSTVTKLKAAGRRVVLAGGISALNIGDAAGTGADVIDVNSSLETAPGVKSIDLLYSLMAAWRSDPAFVAGFGKFRV